VALLCDLVGCMCKNILHRRYIAIIIIIIIIIIIQVMMMIHFKMLLAIGTRDGTKMKTLMKIKLHFLCKKELYYFILF
jgi:hypothetical protein